MTLRNSPSLRSVFRLDRCQSRRHVALFSFLFAAASLSCSEDETVRLPYSGEAYPARTIAALPKRGAFVTNSYSDTISVIDRDTGTLAVNIPVGRDPVGLDGPHHTVLLGTDLYVPLSYPSTGAASGPHAAHANSARAGYLLRVPLSTFVPTASVRLRENPGDVILSEDQSHILVSHFDLKRASNQLLPIDSRRATLGIFPSNFADGDDGRMVTVCAAPHGIVSIGNFAYTACYGEDAIAKVNLDTQEVTRFYFAGGNEPPSEPTVGPYAFFRESVASPRIAVSNTLSKNVRFFDTATDRFEAGSLSTTGAPYLGASDANLANHRGWVVAQTPDEIVAFDWTTGAVTQKRTFADGECPFPHEVSQDPTSGDLYVVCEGDKKAPGKLVILSPETFATKVTIDVGVYPDKLIFFGDAQ
ncbi:MAG: hypothetical protein KBF88_14075 [Polyangiaceae bacterium]|nr:hypothetical protein [Polyangiaceae bacterium]